MKALTLAISAAALLAASPAIAQDKTSWSGPYIGGQLGYINGGWDGTLSTTACPKGCAIENDAGFSDSSRSLTGDSWVAGLNAGYDWQFKNIVVGFVADINWTDLQGHGTFDTDTTGASVWSKQHDLSLDYYGTARTRVGVAWGPFLPYVTGGLAWGQTSGDLAVTYTPPAGQAGGGTSHASTDDTHVGWVVGAGLEWRVSQNWSLRTEYLHMDLGSEDYAFSGKTYMGTDFNTDSFPARLVVDSVTASLNYRF